MSESNKLWPFNSFPGWPQYAPIREIVNARHRIGGQAVNGLLHFHDRIYDYATIDDLTRVPLPFRFQAWIKNKALEYAKPITYQGVIHATTGIGYVLDKTASETWKTITPYNLVHIYQHPNLANEYLSQYTRKFLRYYDAIDTSNHIRTIVNFKKIWLQDISNIYKIQHFHWNDSIHSDYPIYQPNRRILDKSKQFSMGYLENISNSMATFIGIASLTFIAYRVGPARRNTLSATNLWMNRTRASYLPIPYRLPIRALAIKPVVRKLYNPYLALFIFSYLSAVKIGQSIADARELEESTPQLSLLMQEQGNHLIRASWQRGLVTYFKKDNGLD